MTDRDVMVKAGVILAKHGDRGDECEEAKSEHAFHHRLREPHVDRERYLALLLDHTWL